MTTLRIEQFMGMAPKMSDRLLPDSAASHAANARLLSGELRGIRTPDRIHRFTSGTQKTVYRLYKDDGTAVWFGFSNDDVDIVKGPLVNDTYNRHYWSGQEAYIAYNSDTRIENGDPNYKLGTPTPTSAAGLTVTGGSAPTETRAYTFTWVNDWGEESGPAPVVTYTGNADGSWDLSSLPTTMPDATNRVAADEKRIYRTVTGQSSVNYYYVTAVSAGATTYSDTTADLETVLNSTCQTFGWDVPDTSLEGLVAHPGGFLCAFTGRDLHFSERYRPHAWPPKYRLSVEHEIVGLAIYNNMLAVMTKGYPYFFQGNRPENMTPVKAQTPEPCLAKTGIASTLAGVMYPSRNGLVLYNEAGPQVVTRDIVSVEEWANYEPENMKGARYGEQYLAYYSASKAIKFSPSEQLGVFVELDQFDQVDAVRTDHTSGDLWLTRQNDVYQWEPEGGAPLYYTWISKEFDFTKPVNFAAFVVKAEGETLEQGANEAAIQEEYNDQIFAADPPDALHTYNMAPYGGSRSFTVNVGTTPDGIQDVPQTKWPTGGSPLYDLAFAASTDTSVTVTFIADGEEKLTKMVSPNTIHRMPSGFKATVWQIKLVGNANVYSFAMASTRSGLERV